jgi:Zn-dependent peptidase ImmA (M78 family)
MNSLCHELSHLVLDHEAETPRGVAGGRSRNGTQEKEAAWLAGSLLTPNDAAHTVAQRLTRFGR